MYRFNETDVHAAHEVIVRKILDIAVANGHSNREDQLRFAAQVLSAANASLAIECARTTLSASEILALMGEATAYVRKAAG